MYFSLNQKYSDFLKNSNSEMLRNFSLIQEYVLILENFLSLFIESIMLMLIFILIIFTNFKVGILILAVSITHFFSIIL